MTPSDLWTLHRANESNVLIATARLATAMTKLAAARADAKEAARRMNLAREQIIRTRMEIREMTAEVLNE